MSCTLVLPPKPPLECQGGKFGFKQTTQYFKRVGQLKKQLELQYYALPASCDAECKEKLGEAIKRMNKEFNLLNSIFPRVFQRIKNLEHELEYHAMQLLRELEMFLYNLMIKFLNEVIKLLGVLNILNFPIPFLGSTTLIDDEGKPYKYTPRILDFFTVEGKEKIKAAVRERQEDVRKFLKKFDDKVDEFFTGEWNIISPDYSAEELWRRFVAWVRRTLSNFITEVITAIIKAIDAVIPLPDFLKFLADPTKAIEEGFNKIWDKFKKEYNKIKQKILSGELADDVARALYRQAQKLINTLIDTILGIPVPFFGTLGDVLGIVIDLKNEKIPSKEKILAKIQGEWKELMQDIRDFIQRDWFRKITEWLYKTITNVVLDLLKAIPLIGAFIKALTLIMDIINGKISQCDAMIFLEKTIGVPITTMAQRIYGLIPSCFVVEYKDGGYMPQAA